MRQEPRQVLRTFKSRARALAFTYGPLAFQSLVESTLDEDDVRRAFSTSSLLDVRSDPLAGTCYVLHGFGMDEEPLILICRLRRRLIEIIDVYRD